MVSDPSGICTTAVACIVPSVAGFVEPVVLYLDQLLGIFLIVIVFISIATCDAALYRDILMTKVMTKVPRGSSMHFQCANNVASYFILLELKRTTFPRRSKVFTLSYRRATKRLAATRVSVWSNKWALLYRASTKATGPFQDIQVQHNGRGFSTRIYAGILCHTTHPALLHTLPSSVSLTRKCEAPSFCMPLSKL